MTDNYETLKTVDDALIEALTEVSDTSHQLAEKLQASVAEKTIERHLANECPVFREIIKHVDNKSTY